MSNILFLSLVDYNSIKERNIYTDLLRVFITHGYTVYAVSPIERRKKVKTHLIEEDGCSILKLKIGNTQKTNIIEKGISTLTIENQLIRGIRKYFSKVKFDLVLYATPPITFCKVVEYIKKRDNAVSYLMLKDIFPQNAVDIGLISKTGLKGLLYKYFRRQEKRLYAVSDRIGCMSEANVNYVIHNNSEIDPKRVELCPNSIEVVDKSIDLETRSSIREKYGIPEDKKVFVYGGNLGKPQGIPFLIECLQKCSSIEEAYFLIVGDGTEYGLFEEYVRSSNQKNLKLMKRLPKEDYDTMVGACDVGMIFLDHRFTIPNFPSRLLSYMQAKLPVLAVTDSNTDIGKVITEGGFGWWCESVNSEEVCKTILNIVEKDALTDFGVRAYEYLLCHYATNRCYEIIRK